MATTQTTDPVETVQTPAAKGGDIGDKVVGKVKAVAGSVIGDDTLEAEGKLQQAKAEAADEAADKAVQAAHARREAQVAEREQELAAERAERAAEERQATATREAEAERAKRERAATAEAENRKQSAERVRRQRVAQADREVFTAASEKAESDREAQQLELEAEREREQAARLIRSVFEAGDSPAGEADAGDPADPANLADSANSADSGRFTSVRAVPRFAVSSYLTALRLPVTVLERVTGQDRAGLATPPARLFAGFDATIRGWAGNLFRDPVLTETAKRERNAIEHLRLALQLEEEAGLVRMRAADRLSSTDAKAESERESANEAAVSASRKAAQDAEQAKQQAAATERERKQQAREEAKRREDAAAKGLRSRARGVAQTEEAAVAAERATLEREAKALRLDDAVDATKAVRASR